MISPWRNSIRPAGNRVRAESEETARMVRTVKMVRMAKTVKTVKTAPMVRTTRGSRAENAVRAARDEQTKSVRGNTRTVFLQRKNGFPQDSKKLQMTSKEDLVI